MARHPWVWAGLLGAQASRGPQEGRADRERAPGTSGISEFEVNGQLHLPGVKGLYVLIKPGQRGRPISPNRIEQHREAPPAGDPRNPRFRRRGQTGMRQATGGREA